MLALAAAAALALFQPTSVSFAPGTPPEVRRAFGAWSSCVLSQPAGEQRGYLARQRAAGDTFARCQSLQTALFEAQERWLAASNLDDNAKNEARQSLQRGVRQVRGEARSLMRRGRSGEE